MSPSRYKTHGAAKSSLLIILAQRSLELALAHPRSPRDIPTLRFLIKLGSGRFLPLLIFAFVPRGFAVPFASLGALELPAVFCGLSYFEAPASCSPMAIACLGFFTFRPPLALSSPCLNSCMMR
jgi:hypothetical protein